MNLSLCLTHYNRFELLKESFAQVIDDPRINDIVILDDASTDGSYEKIVQNYKSIDKVRVIRQAQNRGMQQNKRDAIAYAKNEWAIIFDSDNVIGKDYLYALEKTVLHSDTIYCPTFAKPTFDYRQYGAMSYNKDSAKGYIKQDQFNMALNTCNYLVPRDEYLKVFRLNSEHVASDTIWFNYNWLKAGYGFYFVPHMSYYHRVHKGSGFLQGVEHNMKMQNEVRKMIMAL